MSDDVTLAHLAAEMAQLQQQIELVKQRLDMIYGAVTRLADTKQNVQSPRVDNLAKGDKGGEQPPSPAASTTSMPLSASMMMDPGTMLVSLHQYAVNLGMDIPVETVDRLKSDVPTEEPPNESN